MRPIEHSANARPSGSLCPLPVRAFLASALVLSVLVLATRLPLASSYLFSWDSANFALALDDYSVPAHRPHPPGYPLYVASAWLVRNLVGDANAAFVALSVIASTGGAVLLLGLAWRLLGGWGAAVAAALFLTSPNVWGHALVAYPYAFLALVATAIAWITAEAHWGRRNLSTLGGLLLGLGAGFRPDLLLLLGPLWALGALRGGGWGLARGAGAVAVAVLVWLVPMLERSGGWESYLEAASLYGDYWTVPTQTVAAFVHAVRTNLGTLLSYLYQTTGPLFSLLLVYGVGRLLPRTSLSRQPALAVVPLWVAPPLAVYTLFHIGNLGYLLSITPAFAIWGAAAALALAEDAAEYVRRAEVVRPVLVGVTLLAAAANAALFLLLSGPVSLREVRDVDAELRDGIALIRQYPAESTLVVSFDRYRQYAYYLPRRERMGLVQSALAQLGTLPPSSRVTLDPPPGVDTIVLPDLYVNTSDRLAGLQRARTAQQVDVFVARLQPGERLRLGQFYARVLPAPP